MATQVKPDIVQRPDRWDVHGDIVIIDDIGRELQAQLWNISNGGFAAECEEKLPFGATIKVDLPILGRVSAEVRWVLGWRFGAMIIKDA